MLCVACKAFCADVGQRLTHTSAETDTYTGNVWSRYRAATHMSFLALERASNELCPICRLIWHGLTSSERGCEDIKSIELEIDPSDQGLPMLYAYFTGSHQQSLSQRRLLAMYGGEMSSSKPRRDGFSSSTLTTLPQVPSQRLLTNVLRKKTCQQGLTQASCWRPSGSTSA